MFCRNCGEQIADQAEMCPNCGTAVVGRSGPATDATSISNHLVGSILVTIFCCLPFGIPAIVYAAQVNSLIAAGDLAGAKAASKNANTFMWVSFGIGLAAALFYIFLFVVGGMRASHLR